MSLDKEMSTNQHDVPDGFVVYTDGSCYTKDRLGSFAWVILFDDIEIVGGTWNEDTTISRMEIMGPIDALNWIKQLYGPSIVLVFSDSEYVVKGIQDRTRKRIKNNDLWDALDALVDNHQHVEFEHVRGHNGDYYNELCDEAASQLRKNGQDSVSTSTKK